MWSGTKAQLIRIAPRSRGLVSRLPDPPHHIASGLHPLPSLIVGTPSSKCSDWRFAGGTQYADNFKDAAGEVEEAEKVEVGGTPRPNRCA